MHEKHVQAGTRTCRSSSLRRKPLGPSSAMRSAAERSCAANSVGSVRTLSLEISKEAIANISDL